MTCKDGTALINRPGARENFVWAELMPGFSGFEVFYI